ncbi:copper chaperone PCu(A)C [Psychromonas sp. RZ22]|uniref:copper chaperone PCu(A)C n=1 Tax=Psychromonas algarum TaxID=2555643 RepID=UPI00106746B8|nr:copper chaperone PCu(A)C [Psychromonas sp. RZ22]TEW55695.1 copper chaperone PCu(A)C [Psychromonas sp. RZ22]
MKRLTLLLGSLLLSANIFAAGLQVSDQYVRATPPHAKNSAAFFTIKNDTDKSVKLIKAESDIADRVELHNHVKEDGMMKMRQVDAVVVEANASNSLQPGGYHVMFLGLKKALSEGEIVKIALSFDNGDKVTIDAPVKKINMSHNMSDKKHHKH